LVISGVTDGRSLDEYLLNVPQYLYAKSEIEGIEYFVDKINIGQIRNEVKEKVIINDEVFFPVLL
jgi:hypothetical protein